MLAIEDLYGSHEVKLPAGDLVPPRPAFHMVALVTRRQRVGSFFWLQSMIDRPTIQALSERLRRDDLETVKLTGIYHNLIR